MSKLLARAKVKRENAENDYYRIAEDDAYLDDCCYNLQQSIEFALKYIIELNGVDYVEKHDLRVHLNRLRELGVELPFSQKIRQMASTLNSWEAESRYNDEFTSLIEDVDDARELADEIISYADSLVCEI